MKTALAFGAALAMTVAAEAGEWRSVETDLDLADCTMLSIYEVGADYACPGYRGYPVLVSESDLRYAVSYGFGAADEPAWRQVFSPFNTPGTVIEWLVHTHPERGEVPVGTILSFFLAAPDGAGPDREVLVVTRIEPGSTCQVAHVDGQANPDAHALAREAAARLIADFDCTRPPEQVGGWTIQ